MDLSKESTVQQIISRLRYSRPGDGPVKVDGTWGSFAPMMAAHISDALKRPVLYVSAHIDDADNVSDDLQIFTTTPVQFFPVWEGLEDIDATDEIGAARLRIALNVWRRRDKNEKDISAEMIISTSVQALNQPLPVPEIVEAGGLDLSVGQTIEPELVASWLVDSGFERVDRVDIPGQFAQRGGIIDIYSPVTGGDINEGEGHAQPVRVEFFGDTVESIRLIDLDTQRSSENIKSICVIAPAAQSDLQQTSCFVNLLPPDTLIILDEPVDIAEVSDVFLKRLDDSKGLYTWQAIYKAMEKYTVLEISRFASGSLSEYLHLDVASASEYEHKAGAVWKSKGSVLEQLLNQTDKKKVLLYCENSAEIDRVTEIIKQSRKKLPANLKLLLGFIRQGFVVNSLDTIVISHHEIFGQYSVRRRIRSIRGMGALDSAMDLQKGDYVVHVSYGIGKFVGIKTIQKAGSTSEYLTIEYADKVTIHVPVTNINLVQKYIGSAPKRPPLSKIGTKKWQKQKQRVTEGVAELAAELLDVQARRESMGGFAFGEDSLWQKEFEESFLYQETPDQITVSEQIKTDMKRSVPMDRLLCGDVGYGKTELAMRAAFKAVEAGKQVAVLVPTTVLCAQHGRTFTERFADFPISIEILNRFTTGKQAKEIVKAAKQGTVDILIGTHRILSDDVGFKDLGLLIIDEEQRFGVEHKERLKRFRVNVDILTMTATPIPRTLHMSMLGLRDISSLSTPPLDRRSIVTRVSRFDKDLIRKAVFHEVNRGGQIFFVHNRVQSIVRIAQMVQNTVNDPQINIDIAHGQMAKHQLEDAMIKFLVGRTHVLVCSAIIESGIDIPNANTMIINDADRFGLAQLHQLRGRVGRYKHRAYAYMMLPASRTITPVAAKRLKAIEEYSQLGAGFRIALRDLEIRGAGNILGPQQSGHINTVGYEMYCRLLSEAVKKLKNEPIEKTPTTVIDLGYSTYIPRSYISSDRQRMDVYRRIALSMDDRDLERLTEELLDLFGPVPDQVKLLIDTAEIRILASSHGIKSIIIQSNDVIFSIEESQTTADLFARAPGRISIPDSKTVYIRLQDNYLEPLTLLNVLRKLLKRN